MYRNIIGHKNDSLRVFISISVYVVLGISIKIAEQIVNPIIVFAANFKELKNKSK